VARGEDVLVCFAGVGLEGLMIAARTESHKVDMIELNPEGIRCIQRGKEFLSSNKAVMNGKLAKDKVRIIEGDVLEIVPSLEGKYDRIIAPRPKEGAQDCDEGGREEQLEDSVEGQSSTTQTAAGEIFLQTLIPKLRTDGGEMHWYDFAADWELQSGCQRTVGVIQKVCDLLGLKMEIIHCGKAGGGTVAKRQWRVCVDFRLIGVTNSLDKE
jgi:tRNA G37 N-methylase Trm5